MSLFGLFHAHKDPAFKGGHAPGVQDQTIHWLKVLAAAAVIQRGQLIPLQGPLELPVLPLTLHLRCAVPIRGLSLVVGVPGRRFFISSDRNTFFTVLIIGFFPWGCLLQLKKNHTNVSKK